MRSDNRSMTELKVLKVEPMERFRIRVSGKLRVGPLEVKFDHRSRYYHCPRCSARTFIYWRRLDIFNPPSSPFPLGLQALFGAVPESSAAFDFYCRSCGAPVRLLFWGQERGMGGWWSGYVTSILELDGSFGTQGFDGI